MFNHLFISTQISLVRFQSTTRCNLIGQVLMGLGLILIFGGFVSGGRVRGGRLVVVSLGVTVVCEDAGIISVSIVYSDVRL